MMEGFFIIESKVIEGLYISVVDASKPHKNESIQLSVKNIKYVKQSKSDISIYLIYSFFVLFH